VRPAQRVVDVPPSGIREIVNRLAETDRDVLPLHIGEPDFAAPPHVWEAAAAQAKAGCRYTQSGGIADLREALADKLRRVNRLPANPLQVMVTHGGVQGCALVLSALLEPGDEVLVADPGWPNHAMMVTFAGGRVVRYPLRARDGFVPDPAEVEALVTDRTRALIMNSPGNPTGAVFPSEVVQALVEITARHDLALLSDEVYDQLAFDGVPVSPATLDPQRVIGVFSFSKTYAMTGWRVGYVHAPDWLARSLWKLQEAALGSLSEVSQAAALAAITGPQGQVAEMRAAYRRRRDLVVGLLHDAGFEVPVPQGAFYVMVPLRPGTDSRAAAFELLDAGVAVAPGSAFGPTAADQIRLTTANADEVLREGVRRFLDWYWL
jgi:aspartate aminotransferase